MTPPQDSFVIRKAKETDVAAIHDLICGLAKYENLAHACVSTEDDLHAALFGPYPVAESIVGVYGDIPVGFALFFTTYSTFLGKPGIYLEDLFVLPDFRGQGCGGALLSKVAQIAVERGCGRLEWSVLNWNDPAIRFYQHLGAMPMDEWTMYRITGDALVSLSRRNKPS